MSDAPAPGGRFFAGVAIALVLALPLWGGIIWLAGQVVP